MRKIVVMLFVFWFIGYVYAQEEFELANSKRFLDRAVSFWNAIISEIKDLGNIGGIKELLKDVQPVQPRRLNKGWEEENKEGQNE